MPNGFWQRAFWVNKLCGSGILRKRFFESGHRHFCRRPAFSWPRFWVLRFCSTAFCRCHFYFYGFLTDACLSAFLILYFTQRSFADLVLCHGGFQGPPDMGRFQRSRWTSGGHFSGRICTAGQRVKRPVWTRRTGGESTPTAADEGVGVDKFFTTLYNIYCSKKPHNMAFKAKITNILYYITGESYGYFSEML